MFYEEKDILLDYSKISAPQTGYIPKLKVFMPNQREDVSKYTPHRPTVLILPGGAYRITCEREGEPIALYFLSKGMNAAVLYYSVAPAVFPVSLLETLTAIKYLREHAEEFNGDKDKIMVCGFSAGGHLAASVGTLWNKKESVDYFGDVESVKPNGLILGYPVITSDYDGDTHSHRGSFINLLGERQNDKEMLAYLCLDRQVTRDTPPAFIWSTFEDKGVPCENSIRFASALRKNGIPFELHIYEKGSHGKATGDLITNQEVLRLRRWMEDAAAWIADERSAYIDQ